MAKYSNLTRRQHEILLQLSSSVEDERQELVVIDDSILSRKISQLSTSMTIKKESMAMKDMKAEIEQIPNYLTKQNKSFQQMMQHIQATICIATTNHDIDELRRIAILIYKIMIIQTYQLLWTTYLKSGMGQLIVPTEEQPPYSITVPIWPKEIKNMNKTNDNESCLEFVNNHLHELNHQFEQVKLELNIQANHFHGYTLAIQNIIETYIEQHLQSFCMTMEHQMELIHYDYHIRALQIEYFRHNPNEYQEQRMKEPCQSKYSQETTEQEYHLLQQQINYYNSFNQSFECSSIAHSSLIDSIQNGDIRQPLFKQYKLIAEQSKTNLFHSYMKSAEDQMEAYRKKYDDNCGKVRSDQPSLDDNQKIPLVMTQLVEHRCQKISERIQCMYKFKAQLLHFRYH